MSLLSKQIANLFNGVSQQTPSTRLPSQADAQVNAYSDVVNGLHKRFPTEHIKKISSAPLRGSLFHTINRDVSEKYQVVIQDGSLQVYGLDGSIRDVSFPDGTGYLANANPRDEMRTLTVEDYTFVVNKAIRPALSVSPYLSTDKVAVSLGFGDGSLTAPVAWPLPDRSAFRYAYLNGFVSGGQPLWSTAGGFSTFADALAAFQADIVAHTSFNMGSNDFNFTIRDIGLSPAYDDGTLQSSLQGIRAQTTEQVFLAIPGINGGVPFDCDLRIIYTKATAGGAPVTDLASLRPDVGWPATPYHIPGKPVYRHNMPTFDGRLYVQVNGELFSTAQVPGWYAEQYVSFFAGAISARFPALTVTVTGWQINIAGAAGEQVFVSAWDTNRHGYVTCVYSELPIRDAVFVVIKNGVALQTYNISIRGHLYSFTSGAVESPETYKVDHIATQLASTINAGGIFQAATFGNFIKVIDPSNVAMTFAAHDTWNDQAMYAMKNRVQAFEDLPVKFIPGHPIEVVGATGLGGFYVHFTQKGAQAPKAYGLDNQVTIKRPNLVVHPAGDTWNAQEGAETGLWEECAKPGTPDVLIPYTMPHVLVSNADGSFTFRKVDWFKRSCGDKDSVPAPSFVGKPIVDVFFHRNRLGFLTPETVLFSRASQFFNFWAQTAKDVLDSDPIDVQVNHTKVATLRSTAVFNNQMLIFSDNTQFVVNAQQLLTPKTISIHPSTEFEYSYKAKPITVGHSVYFLSEKGNWSQAWEYYVQNAYTLVNTADNLTAHVPKYVPAGVFKLASSTTLDVIAALSDFSPSSIFVYKFMWGTEQQGKVQQSWSEWKFDGLVLHAEFVAAKLVVVLQRDDGCYIEEIDFQPKKTEDLLSWLVHLDRKVTSAGVYNTATARTTYAVPYLVAPHEKLRVVNPVNGSAMPFVIETPLSVSVHGEHPLGFIGYVYEMRYRFSPVFMRDKENDAILGSQLTLKTWMLTFEDTLDFRVDVTPEKRKTWTHKYTTKRTSMSALMDAWVPASESFRFPIGGAGAATAIEVISDSHFPVFLQSAVWEGDYVLRTRRA